MSRVLKAGLAAAIAVVALATSAQSAISDPVAYTQTLRSKYAGRVKFETDFARRAVQNFDIDCQAPDGRTLPLMHVMLAKLARLDSKDAYLTSRVDSRGDDVRVYDELVQGGRVIDSQLAFEINKWGELRSHTARIEALRNACFGSYGPIWQMPASSRAPAMTAPSGEAKRLVD